MHTILKFFIALLLTTALTTLSHASFNGIYFGLTGGESFLYGQEKLNGVASGGLLGDTDLTLSLSIPLMVSHAMKNQAGLATVFAGYGYQRNSFYLGGEVFASLSSYHMQDSININVSQTLGLFGIPFTLGTPANINSAAKVNAFQYGLNIRPGILLTEDTLLFANLGTALIHMSYQTITRSASSLVVAPVLDINVPATLNVRKTTTRPVFRLGLGIEQRIMQKWGIRMDYIYSYYGVLRTQGAQRVSSNIPETNVAIGVNLSGQNKIKLTDNAVSIGLSYYPQGF